MEVNLNSRRKNGGIRMLRFCEVDILETVLAESYADRRSDFCLRVKDVWAHASTSRSQIRRYAKSRCIGDTFPRDLNPGEGDGLYS